MIPLWSILSVFLPILCGLGSGVCSYLLLNWTHIKILLSLEARLSEVEGRVNREIKIRAGLTSQQNRKWDQEALDQIQSQKKEPELNLSTWRNQKYKV